MFPPGCWHPYAADSPFNRKIGPSATLGNQNIVKRLLAVRPQAPLGIAQVRHPDNLVATEDGYDGEPTYYSTQADPVFTLHCESDPFGRPDGTCPLDGLPVRIPAGATPEGGPPQQANPGADRHLTVVDVPNGVAYDLWQVKQVRAAGSPTREPASSLPAVAGDLYLSWGGIKQGIINHALSIVVDCDSGTYVYPAQGKGRACHELWPNDPQADVDAPPMGTLLRLGVDPDTLPAGVTLRPWQRVLLRTMHEYGMYLGDTGAQGFFAIEAEAGSQYRTQGAPNAWRNAAQSAGWEVGVNNDLVGRLYSLDPTENQWWIDNVWNNLQVIDPCVPAKTC